MRTFTIDIDTPEPPPSINAVAILEPEVIIPDSVVLLQDDDEGCDDMPEMVNITPAPRVAIPEDTDADEQPHDDFGAANNAGAFDGALDFYPTPGKLISRMISWIPEAEGEQKTGRPHWYWREWSILEPSAGRGDIVKALKNLNDGHRGFGGRTEFRGDIDVIEINPTLQDVLKGQNVRVIHDDFLSYFTFKRYDLIIMNPPFSQGDKHLLKAISMQQRTGGHVVCILNAETIRNPYTNTRKLLVHKLEELNAEIEYIKEAFKSPDAARKTDVEVALIKIHIAEPERISTILDELERDKTDYTFKDSLGQNALVHADNILQMVEQFNFEVRAGLSLINEYNALKPHMLQSAKKDDKYNSPILELRIDDRDNGDKWNLENGYVRKIRYKYWEALLKQDWFIGKLTSNLQEEYYSKVKELQDMDFSLRNIKKIQIDMVTNTVRGIEQTILSLFDKFSHEHHYCDDTQKNVWYFNGWKTNKAHCINKKVIIPMYGVWNNYSGKYEPAGYGGPLNELTDAEKVFDYLDMGNTHDWNMLQSLRRAESMGQNRKIDTKYFVLTFYKKGTCHIEFKDLDLLKKFNIFGSQRKNWLPPSYGKKTYGEMNTEEKAVIDAFEGEEAYAATLAKKDYYIMDSNQLLMLASGEDK